VSIVRREVQTRDVALRSAAGLDISALLRHIYCTPSVLSIPLPARHYIKDGVVSHGFIVIERKWLSGIYASPCE